MNHTSQRGTRGGWIGCLALGALLLPASGFAGGFAIPDSHHGIGVGNLPRFDGIRFNVRDRGVDRVRGINATLWFHENPDTNSVVVGMNLGVTPCAGRLRGIGVGLAGVAVMDRMTGIAVGALGTGCGDAMTGVALGGLGCGVGTHMTGVAIGGLGCGAGETLTGIMIGGIGCGAGEELRGIMIGGIGCGAGEELRGIMIGGVGCGCGEDATGIILGGLGVRVEAEARGVLVGGLRVTAGDVSGCLLSGVHARTLPGGGLTGASIAPFNQIRGAERGVSIGILNYARSLRGVQVGVVNCVANNPAWRRVLPVINF